MTHKPPDVAKWLVESTVIDVKSVLAGYLYDGADMDWDDVSDVRRQVCCDAIIYGLLGSRILFGLALKTKPGEHEIIPGYFVGVMEFMLALKSPPLNSIPNALKTIATMARRLDKAVTNRLGLIPLYVDAFNSLNPPDMPEIPQSEPDSS